MTQRTATTPRSSTTKRQRPAAPAFDLAPTSKQDSFAPVSGPVVSASPEPAPIQERATLPDGPLTRRTPTTTLEESALDLEFFASEAEAVARVHAEEALAAALLDAPPPPVSIPRHVLRRRQALRKAVSVVVGVAALASLIAGVRFASARSTRSESLVVVPAAAPRAEVVLGVAPTAEPKVLAEAAPPAPKPEPAAESATVEHVADRDPAKAAALTKQALSQLERGKFAGAIDAAKQSVDADPTDANAYLYWGTALMESGKRTEAKAVFAACSENATRGPKHECKQFR